MAAERVSLKWDEKKEHVIAVPDPEGMWLIRNYPRDPININQFHGGIDPYDKDRNNESKGGVFEVKVRPSDD